MSVVAQWQEMLATLPQRVLGLSVWLLAMAAVLVPLERRWGLRRQAVIREQFGDDVVYFFLGGILPVFVVVLVAGLAQWARSHGPVILETWLAALPFGWRAILTTVMAELVFYWTHRCSHEWLWRFHAIHHSPKQIDWLVNTRAHPLDLAFSRSLSTLVLSLLGLSVIGAGDGTGMTTLLAVVVVFNTTWGFFIHSNLRWRFGVLEYLITTPAFHHWHHATGATMLVNKNYAGLLPWMDRLFGTFFLPPGRYPKRYGTDTAVSENLGDQLLDPLRPSRHPQDGNENAGR